MMLPLWQGNASYGGDPFSGPESWTSWEDPWRMMSESSAFRPMSEPYADLTNSRYGR